MITTSSSPVSSSLTSVRGYRLRWFLILTIGCLLWLTVPAYATSPGSYTTCSDSNFRDSGGSSNYANDSDHTFVYCPTSPSTNKTTVSFSSFNTQSSTDYLYIYNGNSATGTLLGTRSGTSTPPSYTSTAANGCLTFRFTSNASTNAAGWLATISCTTPLFQECSYDGDSCTDASTCGPVSEMCQGGGSHQGESCDNNSDCDDPALLGYCVGDSNISCANDSACIGALRCSDTLESCPSDDWYGTVEGCSGEGGCGLTIRCQPPGAVPSSYGTYYVIGSSNSCGGLNVGDSCGVGGTCRTTYAPLSCTNTCNAPNYGPCQQPEVCNYVFTQQGTCDDVALANCGTAQGGSYSSQPTSASQRCSVGTYSDLTDTATEWRWKCNVGNGNEEECSALKSTYTCATITGYYSASPTAPTTGMCLGNAAPTSGPTRAGTGTIRSWNCPDQSGCTASNYFCTDGLAGTGVGYTGGMEVCDDGNGTGTDACANDCKINYYLYSCLGSGSRGSATTTTGTSIALYTGAGNYASGNVIRANYGSGAPASNVCIACRDGQLESGEACDDGDANATNSCNNSCQINYNLYSCQSNGLWSSATITTATSTGLYNIASGYVLNNQVRTIYTGAAPLGTGCIVCMDGQLETGEICDDGNGSGTDACANDCKINYKLYSCQSNGAWSSATTTTGTSVSLYNISSGYAISNSVRTIYTGSAPIGTGCIVCGDAQLESGEICDDGNTLTGDACSACAPTICGDLVTNTPNASGFNEMCDGGIGCENDCTCDPDVYYPFASIPGRSCPVGRWIGGCPGAYTCKRELYEPVMCVDAICGDGQINGVEECDAGAYCNDRNGTTGTSCTADASVCPGGSTACQPRHTNACTAQCRLHICGDGLTRTANGEQCDDGNTIDVDTCSTTCQDTYCGDGRVQRPNALGQFEQCDGGLYCSSCVASGSFHGQCNYSSFVASGYGLTDLSGFPLCITALPATNIATGFSATQNQFLWTWQCPGQGGGVASTCTMPVMGCGDGVVDLRAGEECDDLNTTDGDGCDNDCQFETFYTPLSTQCTATTYPQIEAGEVLPIWLQGVVKTPILQDIPSDSGIVPSSVKFQMDAYNSQINPNATGSATRGRIEIPYGIDFSPLMVDAMADYAVTDTGSVVVTKIIDEVTLAGWIGAGTSAVYGQYQVKLNSFTFDYQAYYRTSAIGSISGQTNATANLENCTNNFDDDIDGEIDCADSECIGLAGCIVTTANSTGSESSFATCSDTTDNDGDGKTDCGDENCVTQSHCQAYVTAENCLTSADEDGDGLGSCTDPHCTTVPYCVGKLSMSESYATACRDNLDNDGDGLKDCNDPSCIATVPECTGGGGGGGAIPVGGDLATLCTDNQNNEYAYNATTTSRSNADGDYITGATNYPLIDSFDPQCFVPFGSNTASIYPPEINCQNGDDDGGRPGVVDCNDPTCQFFSAACMTGSYLQRAPRPIETCTGGVDDDNDGWIDCSDNSCVTSSLCNNGATPLIENCTDNADNDGDGYNNCADRDCHTHAVCTVSYDVHLTGYSVPTLETRTFGYMPPPGSGAICSTNFAVSKGYFVQQGVMFSESLSTGLSEVTITSIDGTELVTEGTAIDDSDTMLSTYNSAGKDYLFDQLIDAYDQKALFDMDLGYIDSHLYSFRKVPSAHIYYRDEAEELVRNTEIRDELLGTALGLAAPVGYNYSQLPEDEKPAYTIVVPDGYDLRIEGSIDGNAMYVIDGDIFFDALSCDAQDEVEGLFLTKGVFDAAPLRNTSTTASRRCKGGNLKVQGMLLGANAGSDLANKRRSVLDTWNTNGAKLFNESDSLVYQAKQLFETCYLPNLLIKKAQPLYAGWTRPSGVVVESKPVTSCFVDGSGAIATGGITASLARKNLIKPVLETIFSNAISCTPASANTSDSCFNRRQAVINVLPFADKGIENVVGTIPSGFSSAFYAAMIAAGKRLPTRLENGYTSTEQEDLYRLFARQFEELKGDFITFKEPLVMSGDDLNLTFARSLYGKLYANFSFGMNSTLQSFAPGGSCTGLPAIGYAGQNFGTSNARASYCQRSYYPDFTRLVTQRSTATTQIESREDQLIEGSSVVISARPRLWTSLPPGARDFLQRLFIAPN